MSANGSRAPARGGGAWSACWCAASLSACAPARRAHDARVPGDAPGVVATSPCDSAVRALALPPAVAAAVRDALAAYGGRLVRWPLDRGTPIRVWVQPAPAGVRGGAPRGPSPGPAAAEWTWAAAAGARDWDGVVPGLRFALARDSAAADVRVRWEPPGGGHPGRHRDGPHGHTAVVATSTGVIEGADVTFGGGAGGAPASPADVRALAAHEFGHVLGLVHRAEFRSAMAPDVRADHVSPHDRAVLRAWYGLAAGASCP